MSGRGQFLTPDELRALAEATVPLVPEPVPVVQRWTDRWWATSGCSRLDTAEHSTRQLETRREVDVGDPVHRPPHLSGARPATYRRIAVADRGADAKVVQRILGHASAAMTKHLYGHLIDDNLWEAANRVGGLAAGSALTSRTQSGDIWGHGSRRTGVEPATSSVQVKRASLGSDRPDTRPPSLILAVGQCALRDREAQGSLQFLCTRVRGREGHAPRFVGGAPHADCESRDDDAHKLVTHTCTRNTSAAFSQVQSE
jgi:hypothetical protein